ncbi:Alpha/Beta hydrolase protein [Xylariaceae sp. FL0016]|nr:Alpha/Beta hydrolase protein [Xylariaceae sp. FL0016]
MDLGLSILPPDPSHAHTHTLIFLHGRGDTARGVADTLFLSRSSTLSTLKDLLPTVRFVFPQAEMRLCERDGTDWSQWFDIWNTLDFDDREELQLPGLRESVLNLRRLVWREARRVGGLDKIVLAGISQGGSTAVHVLLNMGILPEEKAVGSVRERRGTKRKADELDWDAGAIDPDRMDIDTGREWEAQRGLHGMTDCNAAPARLAAFIGFACGMAFPGGSLEETREVLNLEGRPSDDIIRHTPVFLGHCVDDPLMFIEYGMLLRNTLLDFGMGVTWREYEDGGHWINSPHGIDDMVEFLVAQGIPASKPARHRGGISVSPD